MDDSVRRAMQIWPDVPECYGWLRLDRRGNWLLTQGDGSAAVGERISNPKVCDFIARNYVQAAGGGYFFQNGPQRVYVELAYTPFVAFVRNPDQVTPTLALHTGDTVDSIDRAWVDEQGALLLDIGAGIALVDDRDTEQMLACFRDEQGSRLVVDDLEARLEVIMNGNKADLWLHCMTSRCLVQPINSSEVERLGFIQEQQALVS